MKAIFLILIMALLPHLLKAQGYFENERALQAGLLFGVNFSQVDGDDFAGFNKTGFHAGVTAVLPISSSFAGKMELLYNQKGSRRGGINFTKYDLAYAEGAFLLGFYDKEKFLAEAGFSVGQLVNDKVELPQNSTDNVFIEKWDVQLMAGIGYQISPKFGATARYSYSALKMGQHSESNYKNFGMFNNVITFRLSFILNPVVSK